MRKPKLRIVTMPFIVLGEVAILIVLVVTLIVFFSGYIVTGYASAIFGAAIEWLADLLEDSPDIDWYFNDIG